MSANINPRMGELIESLLDRYNFPADCRELKELLSNKGFKVSHSSLYAWKRNAQGASESKKRELAEALNFDYEKFMAFLDGKISLAELESSEAIEIPLDEKDIAAWVLNAEPGDLLSIQKLITDRLIKHFESEFDSLDSVLQYVLRQLVEQAIAHAKEEGSLIGESEALKIAISQFAAETGLKVPEIERVFKEPSIITPKQIQAIAKAIGWEPQELQELADQKD